ncbi:MAG: hypothetical protein KAH23_05185 [Kiritimatiellae bacterium]|nr:hypothetical protein [Kiritimatiellia bacterium]
MTTLNQNLTSEILIGVDVGSTVLKAAAFDAASGRVLAEVGERLKLRVTKDGGREQSAVSLGRAMDMSFAGLRKKLGNEWKNIAGIGLAAQGGSTIIVDRLTGKPHTPMMVWNDTRANSYATRVMKGATPAFWRRHTMRDRPGAGLAKILWLKDQRPEIMNRDNMYVGAGEYCYFKLTGLWRQDACNALQIGCYNAVRECLDQRLMDHVCMPLSFVAPLRKGHETHPLAVSTARRLGLSPGIPIAGPYMDHEAGYLSAVGVSKRPLQCSLGTAWVGNFAREAKQQRTSGSELVLPAIVGKGKLVVQPLLTGNVTWDWALEQFLDSNHEKALKISRRIFSKALLPHEGLVALPWLNIANHLRESVVGRAAFCGMGPQTDRDDLVRAVGVSLNYEMRRVFTDVKKNRDVDCLVLGGGASRDKAFRIILASLFAPLPVRAVREPDLSGVRGALYVFSKTVARAKTDRIVLPEKSVQKRILKEYEYYLEVGSVFA